MQVSQHKVDTMNLRTHGSQNCNFSHSKRLVFKNFPEGACPSTPLQAAKKILATARSDNYFCHHILKCHAYVFEKVGRYVNGKTTMNVTSTQTTNVETEETNQSEKIRAVTCKSI